VISLLISITMAYAANPSSPAFRGGGTPSTQLPSYYPASFQSTGTIHRLSSNSIIVTGSVESYSLSPNILVHSLSTEFSSRRALRKGQQIGFSFSKGMDKKRTITEIWLLPRGMLPKL
jgi:hypothetical protein